ncbi:MAG: site-specific recombinase [bacterium]|nr:MAG: site-specific recombinase [bacterium]KAF0149658.1 MAG: site-specific recombinase [bacterium]KAF0169324.1 MAG: site-specific recombinase [bacterium]TXT21402.1 MAG: site-specific recombinase [bacterium]
MAADKLTRNLAQALEADSAEGEDPVPHLARLIDRLRPSRFRPETADARIRILLDLLDARPDLLERLRELIARLFARYDTLPFYTETGILPDRGFARELRRRIGNHLLPEVRDESDFITALRRIFRKSFDPRWLAVLEPEIRREFWLRIGAAAPLSVTRVARIHARQAEAARLLACRCAVWGEHPEARRLNPREPQEDSPFLALAGDLDAWLRARGDAVPPLEGLAACRRVVRETQERARQQGTTLSLTLLLRRLSQSLDRLELLMLLLDEARARNLPGTVEAWTRFVASALRDSVCRDSVRDYLRETTGVLALRVTENASQTGEHYIARDLRELSAMARAALGGGAIIGVLALGKILLHHQGLAPAVQALAYGLNYGLGFVLIYLLGLTVATKQPAMTAATLAAAVDEAHRGGGWQRDRLRAMLAAVVRTQSVAILGNVALALPVALLLAWYLGAGGEGSAITREDAAYLLRDLHPLQSPVVAHAAVAGVCLFLAGLISGYFDNFARFRRIGDRVALLGWLRLLVTRRGATWLGAALERRLGGIMGNLLFGLMLGGAGFIGFIFGLPIDIRHVAFASANLGYALGALDFGLDSTTLAWVVLGVALIALTNLLVSFVLALWVALRARNLGLRAMFKAWWG